MPTSEPSQTTRPQTGPPAMMLNRVSLSFAGPWAQLENEFLEHYTSSSLTQLRFTLVLGLVLYSFFGLLDYIVAPQLILRFWIVRFAIVCPVILLVLSLTFTAHFKIIMQPAIAFMVLVGGGGIIYMTLTGPAEIARAYFAGLMLVLMISSTVVRARFIWASAAGCLLTAAYLAGTVADNSLPRNVLVINNLFCLSANLVGMFASYNLEFYTRRDFFTSHLLQNERHKVQTANLQLEQKVRKRTAMLASANEELLQEIKAHERLDKEKKQLEGQLRQAQKMEAIGTLAGGIAHDFNNILAAIMGHTELALLQLSQKDQAKLSLSEVLRASGRAKELVSQILSFSRHGGSELKPLQINTVIKEALRLIRSTLPTTIRITKSIQDQECIVVGNATQIHQVMMNLCTNAAHAMEGGDGTLDISLKAVEITAESLAGVPSCPSGLVPGRYVCLTVSDTGHGIAPHQINRIFDPYFTTKEKDVGTGLGLAVVNGIVQNHGGVIAVKSLPGKGTTFYIYWPRVESRIDNDFKTIKALPRGHEKILFVDDDPALAELGGKLLAALGYQVITETDPRQALHRIEQQAEAFDLVITDLIMPGLTGELLAKEILCLEPRMPIVACTGFSDRLGEDQLIQSGVKGVLYKPMTIHQIAQVVRRVLDRQPPVKETSQS